MKQVIDEKIEKPPFFKKWNHLYLFIAGWLAFLILIFYLFSESYG